MKENVQNISFSMKSFINNLSLVTKYGHKVIKRSVKKKNFILKKQCIILILKMNDCMISGLRILIFFMKPFLKFLEKERYSFLMKYKRDKL